MYLVPRWADRNLSRLELVSAWILILVLIGTFARHMFVVFARAEQSMVERTATNIRTALKYRAGLAGMEGDYETIREIASENPIEEIKSLEPEDLIKRAGENSDQYLAAIPSLSTPSNYGGEITDAQIGTAKKGYWYYNTADETLVYIIRNNEFFVSDLGGPPRIRFRLTIDYTDRNSNGQYDPGIDIYHSIGLTPVDAYKWVE